MKSFERIALLTQATLLFLAASLGQLRADEPKAKKSDLYGLIASGTIGIVYQKVDTR